MSIRWFKRLSASSPSGEGMNTALLDAMKEAPGVARQSLLPNGSVLRPARIKDGVRIQALVNEHASKGLMLPRSLNQVYQSIREFTVVEHDGQLQGCGALQLAWDDLAEIRSLAVDPKWQGAGIGRAIVESLLAQAEELGVPRVFALTYQGGFFAKLGFRPIERSELPRKIWVDCIDCLKFPHCDEEAFIVDLPSRGGRPRQDGVRKALVADVPEMAEIINHHAANGRMLPRALSHLYRNLRDFWVFSEEEHVIACGALHVLWEDLGEIRAVAVAPERIGRGFGSAVVEALIAEGRALGLPRLFAFTYEKGFFSRFGFRVVDKESLPRKVWGECLDCPKFPNCDELAMVLDL